MRNAVAVILALVILVTSFAMLVHDVKRELTIQLWSDILVIIVGGLLVYIGGKKGGGKHS